MHIRNTALATVCAAGAALLFNTSALAGDVTVQVSKLGSGQPLRDAAVCLGTQANPVQFGAGLADRDGIVRFTNVPRAQLVVTASKFGSRSRQLSVQGSQSNRSLVLALAPGGGGPTCGAAIAVNAPSDDGGNAGASDFAVGIKAFRINNGSAATSARAVTLDFAVSGDATHFRASERADFVDSKWAPVGTKAAFELSQTSGRKRIYLQARKLVSVQGGELETTSGVVSDTIVLQSN